jgi:8-oxo-dGTP pyrophosphatase MutT (NUDIX family)
LDTGMTPATYPVSVKGVVVREGRVLLLRNERDEWELPGGKLDRGEDPEACVVREIREEAGWHAVVTGLLDVWVYRVRPGLDVLIVTYACATGSTTAPVRSAEHRSIGLFTPAEAATLPMPAGYRRSIAAVLGPSGR